MTRARGCTRGRGFTLIELIIVVAVMIVLAGMAVPAFGATIARARIQTNASQMVQDLRLVRDSAITYQQDLYVYICTSSPTAYYYELFQKDPTNSAEASRHYTPHDPPVSGEFVRKDLLYGMSFGSPVHSGGSSTVVTVDSKDYLVLVYCCGKGSYFRGQPAVVLNTLASPYTAFSGSVGVPSVGVPIVDSSARTWYVTVGPAGRATSTPVSP